MPRPAPGGLYGVIALAATTIAELTEKGEEGEAEAFWAAFLVNMALNAGWCSSGPGTCRQRQWWRVR